MAKDFLDVVQFRIRKRRDRDPKLIADIRVGVALNDLDIGVADTSGIQALHDFGSNVDIGQLERVIARIDEIGIFGRIIIVLVSLGDGIDEFRSPSEFHGIVRVFKNRLHVEDNDPDGCQHHYQVR